MTTFCFVAVFVWKLNHTTFRKVVISIHPSGEKGKNGESPGIIASNGDFLKPTADFRFKESGGFTERLSKARLETRDAQVAAQGAPTCPKCGKPMRKIIAKKGRNAGNPFWSCTGYPDCNGTRNYVEGA